MAFLKIYTDVSGEHVEVMAIDNLSEQDLVTLLQDIAEGVRRAHYADEHGLQALIEEDV